VHAYEAMNAMVENRQDDCAGLVVELSGWVFGKLTATFSAPLLSDDDKEQNAQLQALLLSTLHYVVMSSDGPAVADFSGAAMQCLLQIMAGKGHAGVATEEAFMCCGKLVDESKQRNHKSKTRL
jgi:hypothetical protein